MDNQKNIKYISLPVLSKEKISKTKDNKNSNLKLITIILIIAIILLGLFCGYTFAKSIDEKIINSDTKIANPILIIDNEPNISITETANTGIYQFTIKNYDDNNKLTDVDLKYYIEILGKVDSGIHFNLYEGEKEIQLENQKTNYITISKNQKEERKYKIKITYDKNKSQSISDIIQKIQVKVHTEQAKG